MFALKIIPLKGFYLLPSETKMVDTLFSQSSWFHVMKMNEIYKK